jgi:hypothetical protein
MMITNKQIEKELLSKYGVNKSLAAHVVPVQYYQANLARAVEQARKSNPELFVKGDDHLPSWSKFAKDVIQAQGFYITMLQAMFLGRHNLPEIHINLQSRDPRKGFRVNMMFLPATINNTQFSRAISFAQDALPGFEVCGIYGKGLHRGSKFTNGTAEQKVKDLVDKCKEQNKPLLLISRGMAQRSFTVKEIVDVFLCYDSGDAGATTQKIARVLSPNFEANKIGRVWSMSFDPNRDDKFDSMILETAKNYAKRKGIELDQALRIVTGTMDILSCSVNGALKIDPSNYEKQLLSREGLARICGNQANPDALTMEELLQWIEGGKNAKRMIKTKKAAKGKTWADNKSGKGSNKSSNKNPIIQKWREQMVFIVENIEKICVATNTSSIKQALEKSDKIDSYCSYVTKEFGRPPKDILGLFDKGALKYDLVTLQKSLKMKQISY